MSGGGIIIVAQFLTNQNLILKTDKFIGVNYVGDIIAGIYEFGFERSLRNDHTGVADDAGAVTWVGNLKRPYQSWEYYLCQTVIS